MDRIRRSWKAEQESDARLVRLASRGDPRALEPLTERLQYVGRVLRAMNRRLGSPLGVEDLADLAQDTVVVILRKLGKVPPDVSLEGWMYRVCTFELMNLLRRKRKQPALLADVVSSGFDAAPAHEPRPAWDFEDVYRGLELLQADEAAVIRLKFFDELTFDEIGRSVRISPGTAKTRFYRGIVKLQAYLETRYPEARHAKSQGR